MPRDIFPRAIGFLALLEPILGPVVGLGSDVRASRVPHAVTGGIIVLGAVVANEVFAALRPQAVARPSVERR